MLQAWQQAKVMTWAGYILGFPADTPASIRRDIEIIQRELPIDLLEFLMLTPLPGSEDHKKLYRQQVPMHPDMNIYDLEHATTAHPRMSSEEWMGAYHDAWRDYYSDAHVETVLRRAVAMGLNAKKTALMLTLFSGSVQIENMHPLQFGFIRRKVRSQRRPTMPVENALLFYPRRTFELMSGLIAWGAIVWRYQRILKRVLADPKGRAYVDEALRVGATEEEAMPDFVRDFANQLSPTQRASVRSFAAE